MNVALRAGFRFQRTLARRFFSVFVTGLLVSISSANPLLVTRAYAQQGIAKATIVIESVSETSATRGKKVTVTYYQDEQCSRRGKSEKVFKKNYAKDFHRFNPLEVETDMRFIFQVSYLEKRRDETRACDAISSVSLEPNRSYRAVFRVIDEVVGCNIRVFDVTDLLQNSPVLAVDEPDSSGASTSGLQFLEVPVVDSYPESTCVKVGKKGYKSGTPVYSYKDRLG